MHERHLWGWNCGQFCSTATGFRNIRSLKYRKCTEWPNWTCTLNSQKYSIHTKYLPLWLKLTVKSPLYTLNTYPRGPNYGLFRSTTSRIRDTRPPKNPKCTEWPQTVPQRLTIKTAMHTLNTDPWAQIWVRFALRPAVSKILHIL